jgi:aspartyl-tRNA(Asn)/glutamyl-tRNA(Gln) amidotransferase subunit A
MTVEEIARRDAGLGIFWHLAPQPARPASGPLAGMPVAVKDNIDVAGMPTTAGLAALEGQVAKHDAPALARLRAAGAAILGKVSMHEGALGATTDTPRPCQNPLRPGFTPGGSSGGSAAAVAAGIAPLALGTDTMGSVRIPAAYCGVFGLKPTAGLVPRSGVVPLSPSFDTVGPIAEAPGVCARALEVMAGEDLADPCSRPPPVGWHAVPRTPAAVLGLRVGLPRPALDAPMEPEVRGAWEDAAAALQDRGATVAPVAMPGWSPGVARRAGLLLIEAEAAALHEALIDDPRAATPAFRAALDYGRRLGGVRLARALFVLAEARAAALRALDAQDLLLLPTAPQRAFAHGTPAPHDQADFTALANIAGLPALSLPWPAGDSGLPASVQLVGRPHAEAQLVALAEALAER